MQFEAELVMGAPYVYAARWPGGWSVMRSLKNKIYPTNDSPVFGALSIEIFTDSPPKLRLAYGDTRPEIIGMLAWFVRHSAAGAANREALEGQIHYQTVWPAPTTGSIEEHVDLIPGDIADGFELFELLDEIHPFWKPTSAWDAWATEEFGDSSWKVDLGF